MDRWTVTPRQFSAHLDAVVGVRPRDPDDRRAREGPARRDPAAGARGRADVRRRVRRQRRCAGGAGRPRAQGDALRHVRLPRAVAHAVGRRAARARGPRRAGARRAQRQPPAARRAVRRGDRRGGAREPRDAGGPRRQQITTFAYPHGNYHRGVRAAVVEAGFDSAAAVKNAFSHPADDPVRDRPLDRGGPDPPGPDRAGARRPGPPHGVVPRARAHARVPRRPPSAPDRPARHDPPDTEPDAHMTENRTAAVVVCVASDQREGMLRACVDSLLAGTRVPDELFVVVDQNPGLHERLAQRCRTRCSSCRRLGRATRRAATSASCATSDVVAFVDDDAAVEPAWLERMMHAFAADQELVGGGGAVVPSSSRRRWLPDELLWVVGCTYAGHRTDAGPSATRSAATWPSGVTRCWPSGGSRRSTASRATSSSSAMRPSCACGSRGLRRRSDQVRPRRARVAQRAGQADHVARAVPAVPGEGLSKGRLRRRYRAARWRASAATSAARAADGAGHGARRPVRRDSQQVLGAVAMVMTLTVTTGAFVAGLAARGPEPSDG